MKIGGGGDDCGIVGAKLQRRDINFGLEVEIGELGVQFFAKTVVGGNATSKQDGFRLIVLGSI